MNVIKFFLFIAALFIGNYIILILITIAALHLNVIDQQSVQQDEFVYVFWFLYVLALPATLASFMTFINITKTYGEE